MKTGVATGRLLASQGLSCSIELLTYKTNVLSTEHWLADMC